MKIYCSQQGVMYINNIFLSVIFNVVYTCEFWKKSVNDIYTVYSYCLS